MSAVQAGALLEAAVAAPGFHDMWPARPWPPPGSCKAVNGRLMWPWACRACGVKAGDTSRASVAARKPCGAVQWEATMETHEVVQLGVDAYMCSRCGRLADAAHRKSVEETSCMVPRVRRAGVVWEEGGPPLADLLGRIHAFRRWAEPNPGLREAEAEVGMDTSQPVQPTGGGGAASSSSAANPGERFLAGYRNHLCAVVSRKTVCCACFQVAQGGRLEIFRNSCCQGLAPVAGAPPFLREGLRRNGVVAASSAGLDRCRVLAEAHGGHAAALRKDGKDTGGGGGLLAAGPHTSVMAAVLRAAGQTQTAHAGVLPGAVVEAWVGQAAVGASRS